MLNLGTAAMHVVVPEGAFDQPVAFTITRRGDDPAEGSVDPLAGYAFSFGVPTLNANAQLAFTVDLAALARFDGIAGHFSTYAVALVGTRPGTPTCAGKSPSGSSRSARRSTASRRRSGRCCAPRPRPRGKAAKIGALLQCGYRLPFRALTAGTGRVE